MAGVGEVRVRVTPIMGATEQEAVELRRRIDALERAVKRQRWWAAIVSGSVAGIATSPWVAPIIGGLVYLLYVWCWQPVWDES